MHLFTTSVVTYMYMWSVVTCVSVWWSQCCAFVNACHQASSPKPPLPAPRGGLKIKVKDTSDADTVPLLMDPSSPRSAHTTSPLPSPADSHLSAHSPTMASPPRSPHGHASPPHSPVRHLLPVTGPRSRQASSSSGGLVNYATSPTRVKTPASTLSPGSMASASSSHGQPDAFVYSPSLAPNNPFLADIQAASGHSPQPMRSPLHSPPLLPTHPAASSPQATFLPPAHGNNTVMSQTHTQPISAAVASGGQSVLSPPPQAPPQQAASRKQHKVKLAPPTAAGAGTPSANNTTGSGFSAAANNVVVTGTAPSATAAPTSAHSATTNTTVNQTAGPAHSARRNMQLPVIGRPIVNVDLSKQQQPPQQPLSSSPDSRAIPVLAKSRGKKKRNERDITSPSAGAATTGTTDESPSIAMTSSYGAQCVGTVETSESVSLRLAPSLSTGFNTVVKHWV